MYTNILGPSLLDIEYFTGTTTKSVTTIFIWRYSGYLVCSLLIGPVIDRINEYFLIGVSFIGMAMAAALTPWWRHLTIFYVTFTIGGMSSCMGSISMFHYFELDVIFEMYACLLVYLLAWRIFVQFRFYLCNTLTVLPYYELEIV